MSLRAASVVAVPWLAVVLACALGLMAADGVARGYLGEARGVIRCESRRAAEQRLGAPLCLPERLPAAVAAESVAYRFGYGPPPAVATTFVTAAGDDAMVVYQLASAGAAGPPLVPRGSPFRDVEIDFHGGRAHLGALTLAHETWREISFTCTGRPVIVRLRGSVEELLATVATMGSRP